MNDLPFSLQPFPGTPAVSDFSISGQMTRVGTGLQLLYRLVGPLEELIIPVASESPQRRDELWQGTCFECFLAVKGLPEYWEFNLSPAGDWNVYHFSYPRQGMENEATFNALPYQCQVLSDGLSLLLEVDLVNLIRPGDCLEVALTTVLEHRSQQKSYWALVHPGSEPDFHRRDSFILTLA